MTPEEAADARARMVRAQLEERGITDRRVLDAMAAVPREEFVSAGQQEDAYGDHPLPIGCGQTISQPYIVARMLALARLGGDERVLEIGAGSGYQTAVLSRLCREVCALELEEDLCAAARERLERLGFLEGVDLRHGSGLEPWPGGGRFDVILAACAPAELPQVLPDQLRPGGRIIIPVGPCGGVQELRCLRLGPVGDLVEECSDPVRFVPMR